MRVAPIYPSTPGHIFKVRAYTQDVGNQKTRPHPPASVFRRHNYPDNLRLNSTDAQKVKQSRCGYCTRGMLL